MRMRKKKHLDERLNACKSVCLGWLPDGIHEGGAEMLSPAAVFGNDMPLRLEIGCGKGKFANTIAARDTEANFIAVEQSPNVVVMAMEQTVEAQLTNLRYLMGNAEYLLKVLPEQSVERIYLNFSCPYPKTRYAKHRLTSPLFLDIYRNLLVPGGIIIQKTDNEGFFDYSLEQYAGNGFTVRSFTRDLHNSGITGNIITEYEQRFLDQGLPIYYAEAVINEEN